MKRFSFLRSFSKNKSALLEPLEARIAPAANNWIGVSSGNWNTAANWSDGVPTPDDVVKINPTGTLTITIDAGTQAVTSLTMPGDDALAISGGSLAVAVGGNVTATVLAAGLNPANAMAGDSDDSIFGATNAEKLASRIASLVIRGGDITGSYFAAGSFTARPRIGTNTIVLPHTQFRTA